REGLPRRNGQRRSTHDARQCGQPRAPEEALVSRRARAPRIRQGALRGTAPHVPRLLGGGTGAERPRVLPIPTGCEDRTPGEMAVGVPHLVRQSVAANESTGANVAPVRTGGARAGS